MSCSTPLQLAPDTAAPAGSERFRTITRALLDRLGDPWPAGWSAEGSAQAVGLATLLMDAYRRTGDRALFEQLVQWAGPDLLARARSRLRGAYPALDPHEVYQDALVNIYRYPDRFLANRPGAFAAWSTTIVDNVIRRHLRQHRRGACVHLRPPEQLQAQADPAGLEPSHSAECAEARAATAAAFHMLLQCYLLAFLGLSERERYVLQMVEVEKRRYAELGLSLGLRPEAVKMVVFRARRRVNERLTRLLAQGAGAGAAAAVT